MGAAGAVLGPGRRRSVLSLPLAISQTRLRVVWEGRAACPAETTAVALTGAVAAISGAYALGTQVRDGSRAGARRGEHQHDHRRATAASHRWPARADPARSLAQRLGVSQDALRKALDALRARARAPGPVARARPRRGGPGARRRARRDAARLRAALQKLHDAHEQEELSALAKALGVDVARLQGASTRCGPRAPPAPRPPALLRRAALAARPRAGRPRGRAGEEARASAPRRSAGAAVGPPNRRGRDRADRATTSGPAWPRSSGSTPPR